MKAKYRVPIITFRRDAKNSDPNILHHMKNNRIREEKPLTLNNFKESVNKELELNELRNIILGLIADNIRGMKIEKATIKLAQNQVLAAFNVILAKIKPKMYELCPLTPKIAKLKELEMKNQKK